MLQPFNYEYYKRFDYFNASFYDNLLIKGGTVYNYKIIDVNDIDLINDMLMLEKKMSKNYDNYLVKTQEDIKKIIYEYACDNNMGYIYYDNNIPFAYSFGFEKLDYYAFSDLNKFMSIEKLKNVTFNLFSNMGINPYIQARIVNVQKAIQNAVFHKNIQKEYNICIKDSIIMHNNIILNVKISDQKAKVRFATSYDYTLDVAELGKILLCGDNYCILPQNNCFIDKY